MIDLIPDIWGYLITALAGVAVFLGFGYSQRRKGKKQEQADAVIDAQKRVEKGRERMRSGRDKPAGKRLLDNDKHW